MSDKRRGDTPRKACGPVGFSGVHNTSRAMVENSVGKEQAPTRPGMLVVCNVIRSLWRFGGRKIMCGVCASGP